MAMIHINRNRENIGKFNEQEVADGLKSGRFLPTDLAWREPMTNWEPLSNFTDLPPTETADETNITMPADSRTNQGGTILLGECFSKGWENFQKNMGTLVLGTFVFLVVNAALSFVQSASQNVMMMILKPGGSEELMLKFVAIGVGIFFAVLTSAISMILSAGLQWMCIKNSRDKCEFADLFAGFSSGAWIQMLIALVAYTAIMLGLALLIVAPGFFIAAIYPNPITPIAGFLLLLIPAVYLGVGLTFVCPLILDRRIGWQEALRTAFSKVHRQWFAGFVLVLINGLLCAAGILLCCVGLIFTMPLGLSILAEGYRQLFGDPPQSETLQS